MEAVTSYYLPRWRSVTVGSILIVFGLAINLISLDLNQSFWRNFQHVVISFEGVSDFLFSLLMLGFKLGFIIAGYFYIKYSKGIERARLDDKGFSYREIPNGSRAEKLAIDAGRLSFVPYQNIRGIEYKKTFWNGARLYLTLATGTVPLPALGVLSETEKQDIMEKITEKISSTYGESAGTNRY